MIALLLSLTLQQVPPQQEPVTSLEDVVVTGQPLTGLLRVTVDGAADVRTLVTTQPDLRCGKEAFRWEDYGRPRLCWLRRERGQVVVLQATSEGRPGVDWHVDWAGCSRIPEFDQCEITIEASNTVRATFRTGAATGRPDN